MAGMPHALACGAIAGCVVWMSVTLGSELGVPGVLSIFCQKNFSEENEFTNNFVLKIVFPQKA